LHSVDYSDGRAAGYAEAGRLAQAAGIDMVKSVQILQHRIFNNDLTAIYGGNAPDAQQQAIAAILAETAGIETPFPASNPRVSEQKVDVIRRQMVMTLEMLEETYKEISKEIISLSVNPPPAPLKPPLRLENGDFSI
jgi:hypothetical protein